MAELNSWRDLREPCRDLAIAESERRTPVLDFSPLDAQGHEHRRLDPLAVSLLSNLLVGRFRDLAVEVILPRMEGPRLQLRRGGLPFALAQREADTQVVLDGGLTEGWFGAWRPGTGDRLFSEDDPTFVGARTAIYVNTHRLGSGYFRNYLEGAAIPWLYDVVPVPEDPFRKHIRNEFVRSANDVAVELFDNVGRHAFRRRGPIQKDRLSPHGLFDRSLLMFSVTRGSSADRLHVIALDNGYGIGRTLRWRHPGLEDSTSDLIRTVLERRFVERGISGHAGRGLWYVADLARCNGGHISVVTTDDIAGDSSGVMVSYEMPSHEDGEPSPPHEQVIDLPIEGSVVHAVVRIPSHADYLDSWTVRPGGRLQHAGEF